MQSAGKKPAFIVTISVCTYGCDRVGGIFFYRCAFLQPIVFLFIRHIDPVTLIDNWKIVVIFINIIFPKDMVFILDVYKRQFDDTTVSSISELSPCAPRFFLYSCHCRLYIRRIPSFRILTAALTSLSWCCLLYTSSSFFASAEYKPKTIIQLFPFHLLHDSKKPCASAHVVICTMRKRCRIIMRA